MSTILAQREAMDQHFTEQKPRKLRAIIYCRVSTDKQEQDGESLDYQEEKCRQYADTHSIEVITALKEAKSGFMHYSLREKLTLARQMVRDGLADCIIVWDLRRFSRNFVHSAMIFQEIEEAGGSVISVSENIDNSPTGQLIRMILAWFAESERHKIVEYANRHWQTRLEAGLPIASRAKYGWKWGNKEKTEYLLDLEQAAIRFSLFHMYVELEMSLRQIAHKLTEDGIRPPGFRSPLDDTDTEDEKEERASQWNIINVKRMMEDPANIGILELCKTKRVLSPEGKIRKVPNPLKKAINGGIPAILTGKDEALYWRALAKIGTNQRALSKLPEQPEAFLLKDYVFCETCGYRMRPQTVKRKRVSGKVDIHLIYLCPNNKNKYHSCPDRQCVNTEPLGTLVWSDCCLLFERIEQVQAKIEQDVATALTDLLEHTTGREQLLKMEAELKAAHKEQAKYQEGDYLYGLIAQDIATKEQQLARYREEMGAVGNLEQLTAMYQQRAFGFLDFLRDMRGRYHEATFQEKRNALDVLGVRVIVHPREDHLTPLPEAALQDEWISSTAAASLLGIDRQSLYRYTRSGQLTTTRSENHTLLVLTADLAALRKEGVGQHNTEEAVRKRITIEYAPQIFMLPQEADVGASGERALHLLTGVTPATASSMTTQAAGGTFSPSAARRKISGAGLPLVTLSPETRALR